MKNCSRVHSFSNSAWFALQPSCVFERGAGETLACGTGACAAVVTGISRGLLDSPVRVTTHGGDLTIAWDGKDSSVLMSGPAVTVFTGEIEL